jgi:hypothetical protein
MSDARLSIKDPGLALFTRKYDQPECLRQIIRITTTTITSQKIWIRTTSNAFSMIQNMLSLLPDNRMIMVQRHEIARSANSLWRSMKYAWTAWKLSWKTIGQRIILIWIWVPQFSLVQIKFSLRIEPITCAHCYAQSCLLLWLILWHRVIYNTINNSSLFAIFVTSIRTTTLRPLASDSRKPSWQMLKTRTIKVTPLFCRYSAIVKYICPDAISFNMISVWSILELQNVRFDECYPASEYWFPYNRVK